MAESAGNSAPASGSRRSIALRFVLMIGVVSFFADFTYEGSRSITGPFLGAHHTVNHGKGEYSRKVPRVATIHTNTIEGVFSILKRGLTGVYHQVGSHHPQRYSSEFDYRYKPGRLTTNSAGCWRSARRKEKGFNYGHQPSPALALWKAPTRTVRAA